MKAYNDFEKKAVRWNRGIPPLDAEVFDWALNEAMPSMALVKDGDQAMCLKCRNKFPYKPTKSPILCSKCGSELEPVHVSNLRKLRLPYDFLFKVRCRVHDVELIRTFRMRINLNVRNGLETYDYTEISRHWDFVNEGYVVTARPIVFGIICSWGRIKIRRKNLKLYDWYHARCHEYPEHLCYEIDGKGFCNALSEL